MYEQDWDRDRDRDRNQDRDPISMAICGIEIGIEIWIEILIEWPWDRIEIGSIQKFEMIEDRDRLAQRSGSTRGLVGAKSCDIWFGKSREIFIVARHRVFYFTCLSDWAVRNVKLFLS